MYQPLAEQLRPKCLEDVLGQSHLLGKDGFLPRLLAHGHVPNLIFYGASGVGKTTVAELIAQHIQKPFYRLNATTATLSDLKACMDDIGTLIAPQGIVVYLDEIQYFNKKQQQSLLESMENGKLTLIASTTENPYFAIHSAVLSRATVLEFQPLTLQEVTEAVSRAISVLLEQHNLTLEAEENAAEHIAQASGGDVRKALNLLEALFLSRPLGDSCWHLQVDALGLLSKGAGFRYDRDGDGHFDTLSAFQKSIRGSDTDAALHYLARLLTAGDLLSVCRRLLVTASEDIGLAYPQAMSIVKSCVDTAQVLGLPEARIPLAQAVILLATAPKSNSVLTAIDAAMADIQAGKTGDIPPYLKDAHYTGAKQLGRGLTYQYPHDFPRHFVPQQYLPLALQGTRYYQHGDNKHEQAARQYWASIRGLD